jgi:hypothetical protein
VKRLLIGSLALAVAVGFLTWLITLSIGPLQEWTQETGACRGADEIERDVTSGGTAISRGPGGGNSTTEVSTTVFELRCSYDDGEVRLVDNDQAVLKGMAVGFLAGFVPAFLLSAGWQLFRMVRRA